jgi:sigma-B regulation protein RsbU (phosphoserine phosphatase)
MRLLVVDDDPVVRQMLTNSLKRWGAEVTGASSGEEALRIVEGLPRDPGADGDTPPALTRR